MSDDTEQPEPAPAAGAPDAATPTPPPRAEEQVSDTPAPSPDASVPDTAPIASFTVVAPALGGAGRQDH